MKHLKSYKLFESVEPASQLEDFDIWFDKSKVSKNGKPIVVYHGTNHKFDKFDMSWQGKTDDGFYGRGFYFTEDEDEAREYGDIVMEAYLKVENPFYLRTYSSVGSAVELDLRDDLARLKGMPKDLQTVRTLPDGYSVERSVDDDYDKTVTYTVHPDSKFYGTDKEIYGPDIKYIGSYDKQHPGEGVLQATVAFNDMINNIDYESGQANWLLQKVDRDRFSKILTDNGYDGIFVVRADGPKTPIEEVSEFIVWDPDNIRLKDI